MAGLVAAIPSGLPSTAMAFVAGDDPLEATRAAGSMLLPRTKRTLPLLAAAVPVHLGLSVAWGVVLSAGLPRRWTVAWGAAAGAAIGTFDLLVVGRRFERIRALPFGPQLADHVAYGAVAGATLSLLRRRREREASGS